jgi:hypothetical protein
MQQDVTTVATKRGAKPDEPPVADVTRAADAIGADSPTGEPDETAALRQRIARLEAQAAADADVVERAFKERMELLRLRDLVVSTERMLGSARGEIERLNDRLVSYEGLVQRHHDVVTSTTWKVAWKVFAPLRNYQTKRANR